MRRFLHIRNYYGYSLILLVFCGSGFYALYYGLDCLVDCVRFWVIGKSVDASLISERVRERLNDLNLSYHLENAICWAFVAYPALILAG